MQLIVELNIIISMLFSLCYFYQIIYIFVGLIKRTQKNKPSERRRYAVIVSARNEEAVIANLIKSINEQTYPSEYTDIYVVADNCTDKTAETARNAGAIVYERRDKTLVGKGYALDWLFGQIEKNHSDKKYDAYIVFDADNVLSPEFIEEMNSVFNKGYKIITSYRNSKNYGVNWITAGYSLWFLREARFLNKSRMVLGTSCAISGTGFLVSTDIIRKNGGWIHHLLTEDIEFTTDSIIHGEKIGYCEKAVLYDEQPVTFYQSYLQRLRWSKGFYQVFRKYGKSLAKGIFKGSFACFDMLMTIMPAMLLTLLGITLNIVAIPVGIICDSKHLYMLFESLGNTFTSFYMMFFIIGFITTLTEWKQIHCTVFKKLFYTLTFPLFMLTYIPISIIALFKDVKWEPINHSVSKSVAEICTNTKK